MFKADKLLVLEFAVAPFSKLKMPASLEHRLPKLPVTFADLTSGTDDAGAGADWAESSAGTVNSAATTNKNPALRSIVCMMRFAARCDAILLKGAAGVLQTVCRSEIRRGRGHLRTCHVQARASVPN